jgi:hypothetical protein
MLALVFITKMFTNLAGQCHVFALEAELAGAKPFHQLVVFMTTKTA